MTGDWGTRPFNIMKVDGGAMFMDVCSLEGALPRKHKTFVQCWTNVEWFVFAG